MYYLGDSQEDIQPGDSPSRMNPDSPLGVMTRSPNHGMIYSVNFKFDPYHIAANIKLRNQSILFTN